MSQSDYIKFVKTSNRLALDMNKKQSPVFEASTYLDYKEYVLGNTIPNTNIIYHMLTPNGEQIVFDIERRTTNCPTINECKNTNQRANRRPMPAVYYTPKPQPLNWKQKKNTAWLKTPCNCCLNSVNTLRYVCKCKTQV